MPLLNIERQTRRTGRTGIAQLRFADDNGNKKRVGIYRVDHPVDSAPDAAKRKIDHRTVESVPPINFRDLNNAYHRDGYVRQSVDKYAEKMVLSGHRLESKNEEAIKYLNYRMLALGKAAGYDFHLLITDVARRLVRDGNVFLAKGWNRSKDPLPGYTLRGLKGRPVIGAFFLLDAQNMVPLIDRETGERKGWIHQQQNGYSVQRKLFPIDQVYHFTYCPEGMDNWGYSQIIPAIEDVKALRDAEEGVLRLMYRSLSPLLHIAAPDVVGDGFGRQEDVDIVTNLINQIASDGYIVTGPDYKINSIGAESQALRADPYLAFFKARSFSSLGVSDLIMGEAQYMGSGGANAVTVQMSDRVRFLQFVLSRWLTSTLIYDLLVEADIDPIDEESGEYSVTFGFNEFDTEELRAKENHEADLFSKDVLSRKEVRANQRRNALTPDEENDTFQAIKARLDKDAAMSQTKLQTDTQIQVAKMRPKPATKPAAKKSPKK